MHNSNETCPVHGAMSQESAPLISVIVAVFNGKDTLQQCIDSVARQTYPNRELIIIDGGSSDGTVDLLEQNRNKISYWISEPDNGLYSALNKGLAQAKGDWICILGADDYLWDEHVLAQMSEQLQQLPAEIRVAYGRIMLVNADGEVIHGFGVPWEKARARFRQTMSIPHQGTMHRRSLFEQRGKFDASFRIAGDYELLLRELITSDARFIPGIIVAAMRQGGGISSSPQNSLAVLRESRRAQLKHGLHMPGRIWLMSVARLYLRLSLWKILGEQRARKMLDLGRRVMGLPPFWTRT